MEFACQRGHVTVLCDGQDPEDKSETTGSCVPVYNTDGIGLCNTTFLCTQRNAQALLTSSTTHPLCLVWQYGIHVYVCCLFIYWFTLQIITCAQQNVARDSRAVNVGPQRLWQNELICGLWLHSLQVILLDKSYWFWKNFKQ